MLAPIFETTCKDGRVIVDYMNVSVVTLLNKLVWSIPRNSITSIVQKPGFLLTSVEIYSIHGLYVVRTMPKPKANELVAILTVPSNIQSQRSQMIPQQPQVAF